MAKKSHNFAARFAALGLKVISNDAPVNYIHVSPLPSPRVVPNNLDSSSIKVRTATLAKWLEEQYHANLEPFHFLSDVPLNITDKPDEEVIEGAIASLRAGGWQIHRHPVSGGRGTGYLTMMHPDSVGF